MLKEVVVEDVGYLQQQLGVDAGAVEDFVYVGAVTFELARKPHHRALLTSELFFNKFPNKYLFHNR